MRTTRLTRPGDEVVAIRDEADIVRVRHDVRDRAAAIGLSSTGRTKFVTAASEIARNTLKYGGGGTMRISSTSRGMRRALELVFQDRGPGIPDIALAMTDRFTTGGGMGLGLGGAKRLCDEFEVTSDGTGTRVVMVMRA